jgi:hypothetical protein
MKTTALPKLRSLALLAAVLRATAAWAADGEPLPVTPPPDAPLSEPGPSIQPTLAPASPGGLWMHPFTAAAFGVAGILNFPVGGWVAVSPELDVAFEVSPLLQGDTCASCRGFKGVWTSIGVSIHGPAPEGFFFQPKLQFAWFEESYSILIHRYENPVFFHEWSRQLTVGVDVGYQVRWGALYAALMAGAWVGYGQNVTMQGPNEPYLRNANIGLFSGPPRGNQVIAGLNLNLLRVGFAF